MLAISFRLLKFKNIGVLAAKMSSSSDINCSRLKGKVSVISASTEGIGFAIAERLAQEGSKVVISSRKASNVEKAVSLLQSKGFSDVHGVVCHVGNKEDRKKLFEEAVERFSGIDVLVSNAAVNPEVGGVMEASEKAWDKIFDINVKSSFLLAKEVKPYLMKRGGGSIIFISSIAGFQPFPLLGAYSISKTALFGLTKAAANDLAPHNIRVNCVAPGVIKTKFSSALYESEAANEEALKMIPLGKLGQPREVAAVVAFLASDDGSYVTGENIVAAGGMSSRL